MSKDEHERDRFARLKDAGEFVFAAILTAYGVFGYNLLRDQLRVMQQQTKLMQDQVADARRAAAEADKLTERQFKIAESQAESLKTLAATNKAMVTANERQVVVAESQATSLRRQADALHRQLESMSREIEALSSQAASMRTLADANKTIAEAASISADAAKRAANTSAQQLEITDRPWVRVAAVSPVRFDFTSPSSDGPQFTPHDMANVEAGDLSDIVVIFLVDVELTNTGRSVANDIRVLVRGVFPEPKELLAPMDVDKLTSDTCDWAAKKPPGFAQKGKTLFTGEKITELSDASVSIRAKDVAPPTFSERVRTRGKSVGMFLVGCVVYTFSNSPAVHRTWFTYRLGNRGPKRQSWPYPRWAFEIGKEVPLQDVFLQQWDLGGNGAD